MKDGLVFVPSSPIEERIRAGDVDGVIAALRNMHAAERKRLCPVIRQIEKSVSGMRWENDGKLARWWGSLATPDQHDAARAALFFCGETEDRADNWLWNDRLYPFLDLLDQGARQRLATDLVARRPVYIRVAQRLVLDKISERPQSDAYIIGLICVPQFNRDSGSAVLAMLEQDPGLLDGPLMRIFEVEGDGDTNMSSIEKYTHAAENTWTYALLELVRAGKLTRAQLLDKTLATLESDWPQFRAGWFSRFHAALAPTTAEMGDLAGRYLGLCHSRIAPTVTLALGALAVLVKHGMVDSAALFDALVPVMSAAGKGQVEVALKLLDQVIKREPGKSHAASALAHRGLSHESPELHKKIIARLSAWGFDHATRAQLVQLLPYVAAVHRDSLAALLGEQVSAAEALLAPVAPSESGLAHPLALSRRLAPLEGIDELVQTIAFVFENERETDQFERAVEALVRLGLSAADMRERFLPVLKRAHKILETSGGVANALARLLRCAVEHIAPAPCSIASSARGALFHRVADLIDLMALQTGLAPLSGATHKRGFIEPLVLLERVEAYAAAGIQPVLAEQVRALLRLASGPAPEALARMRVLEQTAFVQAFRYALGDDVAIGADRALFIAAARIRHPGADDVRMLAQFGDLGPDAACVARYNWQYEKREHAGYKHCHLLMTVMPQPGAVDPAFIAVARHVAERRYDGYWSGGEAMLNYAASILPSDLEAFFAEGALQIGNNLDWWEARWQDKAQLALLIDRATPITPSAIFLLALGLGGKEPGQTAMAVDAFVAAVLEHRVEPVLVAGQVRAILLSSMGKCARYAKSLRSAARAHPSMPKAVCDILCSIVDFGATGAPKGAADLLELLMELSLGNGLPLPSGALATIGQLTLTGKAKAAQAQLLARFA